MENDDKKWRGESCSLFIQKFNLENTRMSEWVGVDSMRERWD